MKAATCDRYGPPDVVHVTDLPTPEPGSSEVLVRVEAAAVTAGDARIRGARFPPGYGFLVKVMFGFRGPRRKILGSAFSGVVEKVGSKVTVFAPGDEVCGMAGGRMGAHAEYMAVAAKRLTRKPAGVSHADAAGILFGGGTALNFLRDRGGVGPGSSVLINGASGSIGTAAVQLAKQMGATVAAVSSSRNLELLQRLGADRTIDYNETPFTGLNDRFDVVFDTVGNIDRKSGTGLLSEDGVLLLAVASLSETIRPGGRVKSGVAPEDPTNFEYLLKLVEAGQLDTVTEELDGLESITDAYRRIDSGHKVGNLVLRLTNS